MATITINIDDSIDNKFRDVVKEKYGFSKGSLGNAFSEALKQWIKKESETDISIRQIKLMEIGLNLNIKKFNRSELYER